MEFYNYKFYIIYKIPSWYWKHITLWTGPGFPKLSSEIILQLFCLGWKEEISRNKQAELFKASSVLRRSAVDPSSMILLTQNQTKEKKAILTSEKPCIYQTEKRVAVQLQLVFVS